MFYITYPGIPGDPGIQVYLVSQVSRYTSVSQCQTTVFRWTWLWQLISDRCWCIKLIHLVLSNTTSLQYTNLSQILINHHRPCHFGLPLILYPLEQIKNIKKDKKWEKVSFETFFRRHRALELMWLCISCFVSYFLCCLICSYVFCIKCVCHISIKFTYLLSYLLMFVSFVCTPPLYVTFVLWYLLLVFLLTTTFNYYWQPAWWY